ncbi:hypothetical protein MF406_14225 [Georgenia sp. TF02-10]|uniref:hypothetical protein n=1 Tax=Georgenia sp. TF02-10 TaxID=2917725 RepID=UPI001FA6E844|nr:hypothetical protein [Georgenia sp. TF02-10]UNX54089.1 hypothetical protein MF406_14225 [Georgenia sp. TF02-10]
MTEPTTEPTPDQDQTADQTEQAEAFEPITSQEELNRRIGQRLERERSKFADYDDLKAKASRLDEIEDANKTEVQKAAERAERAEAEAQQVPAKVAAALRQHLVQLHEIDDESAELFLTADDPERLLKQVQALVARSKEGPRAPRPNAAQGGSDIPPQGDWLRQQLART